jgi:hypothetical protein
MTHIGIPELSGRVIRSLALIVAVGMGILLQQVLATSLASPPDNNDEEGIRRWVGSLETWTGKIRPNADGVNRLAELLILFVPEYDELQSADSLEPLANIAAERSRTILRDKLMSIPGYADILGRQIRETTDYAIDGVPPAHPFEWKMGQEGVNSDREAQFRLLLCLPRGETIRILGELLEDTRDRDGQPKRGEDPLRSYQSNAELAAFTLERMGLKNRPKFNEEETAIERVGIWRKWIEQARFGARKISFEGDPREYSLVEKPAGGAPPRPVKRPSLSGDPAVPGEAGQASAGGASARWIIAAVLALGAGGGFAWLGLRPRAKPEGDGPH